VDDGVEAVDFVLVQRLFFDDGQIDGKLESEENKLGKN
jgi:hypothetical protein